MGMPTGTRVEGVNDFSGADFFGATLFFAFGSFFSAVLEADFVSPVEFVCAFDRSS